MLNALWSPNTRYYSLCSMVSIFSPRSMCDVSYKFSSLWTRGIVFEILNLSAFIQCNQINLSALDRLRCCGVRSIKITAIVNNNSNNKKENNTIATLDNFSPPLFIRFTLMPDKFNTLLFNWLCAFFIWSCSRLNLFQLFYEHDMVHFSGAIANFRLWFYVC